MRAPGPRGRRDGLALHLDSGEAGAASAAEGAEAPHPALGRRLPRLLQACRRAVRRLRRGASAHTEPLALRRRAAPHQPCRLRGPQRHGRRNLQRSQQRINR